MTSATHTLRVCYTVPDVALIAPIRSWESLWFPQLPPRSRVIRIESEMPPLQMTWSYNMARVFHMTSHTSDAGLRAD